MFAPNVDIHVLYYLLCATHLTHGIAIQFTCVDTHTHAQTHTHTHTNTHTPNYGTTIFTLVYPVADFSEILTQY